MATNTHVGILPLAVLDALSTKLNEGSSEPEPTRFLRLPHPRTGIPSLFLSYQSSSSTGSKRWQLLEVQAVTPPNARSWFLGEEVISNGKLLIMTPIDPVFLLIPILLCAFPGESKLRLPDDIFEEAATRLSEANPTSSKDPSASITTDDVLRFASLDCVTSALRHLCEIKEVTPDITVYRFSQAILIKYLRRKVARIAAPQVFEESRTMVRGLAKDGLMEDGKEDLLASGRIRAACDLVAQYLPRQLRDDLIASYDLQLLDDHYRALQDDVAAALVAADAKAKKVKTKVKATNSEDSKKRKNSGTSQGVEKLKKVNVNGMSKMSSFFKKA